MHTTCKDSHKSSSKVLNTDSHALATYLLYFNRFFPLLHVACHGTHEETRTRTSTDSDGNSRTEMHTETVTDFQYSIDLTSFIEQSQGSPDIYAYEETVPSHAIRNPSQPCADAQSAMEYDELCKNKMSDAAHEVVNSYIRNGNPLKTMSVEKEVVMNYDNLKRLIHDRIRQLGYRHSISITFPMKRKHIRVRQKNDMSFFGNTRAGRYLCALSCMWIVFFPVYCIVKECCYKERELNENKGKEVKASCGIGPKDMESISAKIAEENDISKADFSTDREYRKAKKKRRKEFKKEIERIKLEEKKKARKGAKHDRLRRKQKEIQTGKSQLGSCEKKLKALWGCSISSDEIYERILHQIRR